MTSPVRYESADEDSARWAHFRHRPGDIVVSTRSKHGTTWMQMICALLVFRSPELPDPLGDISPWLDWRGAPVDEVCDRLARQHHRRIIKTHTPLDGLPAPVDVHHVVVARHPLDAALSLRHQADNLDRERMRALTGSAPASDDQRKPADEWLLDWIDDDPDPRKALDSLPGVFHHLSDAWSRRHEDTVHLVRYEDLLADLGGEMRRLAAALDIDVPQDLWPDLERAASFTAMKAAATTLIPDRSGVLKDPGQFFRRGTSGGARELLGDEALERYHRRARELAPDDLVAWLHAPPGTAS